MLSSLLNFVRIIVSLLCFSRRFVGYFTVWIVSPRSHTARSASAIRDIIGGLPSAGYTYLSAPPSNRSLALILCALIGGSILPQPDLQYKGAFVTFRSQTCNFSFTNVKIYDFRSFFCRWMPSERERLRMLCLRSSLYGAVSRKLSLSPAAFPASPKRTLPQRKTQSSARRFLPLAALHARFVSLPAGKTPPCGLRRGAADSAFKAVRVFSLFF